VFRFRVHERVVIEIADLFRRIVSGRFTLALVVE
jgi:hypothetical protein